MPPVNTDLTAAQQAILNDVWDESRHLLRVDSSGGFLTLAKVMTFAGGTTNDPGDFDGSGTPWTLWTASGELLVAIIALCRTTLTGASGTFAAGISGATNRFIPVTTATTISAGATVDHTGLVAAGTAPLITPNQAVSNGQVIIGTTATADITAGVLAFYAFYKPLTPGASLS